MRAYALLILLTACGSPAAQPMPDTKPKPVDELRSASGSVMEVIPYQRWIDVPSYVVGILYEAGAHEWGGSVNHMRMLHTGTQRNEYKFSFDATSPYALYFESDGRGYNYLTGWGVPIPGAKYDQFDAAMFDASTQNEWGLSKPAHLVELEVNNGRGGGGLHFVVTDARVLDGTDDYPLDPTEVFVALRKRFDADVDARRDAIAETLSESKRRAEAQVSGTHHYEDRPPPPARIAIWPTWHRERRRLAVTFVYATAGAIDETIPAEEIKHPDCPPGAPCVDWGPPEPQNVAHPYGVDMGATYEVDPAGNVTGVTIYEPTARREDS